MPSTPTRSEIEAIERPLEHHADQLWGPQKATELKAAIESTAATIARLKNDLPTLSEEPGFYFQ